jgi:hypothetical protein
MLMKRLLLLAGALVATTALALPAGAASPPSPAGGSSGGSAPGKAQVGIQSTSIGTDVSPINGFWNQGWWSNDSANLNSNTNYIAGHIGAPFETNHRDYFTFDITALNAHPCATPQSATLRMVIGAGEPFPPTTFLNYQLYGVATDPFVLSQKVNNPDAAIFFDLGSGPLYGSYFLPTTAGTFATFTLGLNLTALNALAAAKASGEQFFSFGGSLVPQPPDPGPDRYLFGFTHVFSAPAVLTVNWPFICRIRPPV